MKIVLRYIMPLSVISLCAFLFAIKLFFTPSEHGAPQYLSLFFFFLISLPSLIANALVNNIVSNKKKRIFFQIVLSAVFLLLSCYLIIY